MTYLSSRLFFRALRYLLQEEVGLGWLRQVPFRIVAIGLDQLRPQGEPKLVIQRMKDLVARQVYEPTTRKAFRSDSCSWPKYRSIGVLSFCGK